MSPDLKRTLLVDAAIVVVLVVLALILAPGLAIVGIVALIVLFAGAVSFIFGEVRARRRLKRAPRGARVRRRGGPENRLKAPARRDSRSRRRARWRR